ncbi:MAG: tripartite tricarboxylate transporter substrate binding protein [Deltaproteobacteria bacterium]|nr:tripartite tricarboxylate transporter substrate binding protein [Deltaproteobacteria bacterium]
MKSSRLIFMVVAALALLFAQAGMAQEEVSKFPSKPITYVCPVPPGTTVDLSTRLMAKELEKIFGQPVVVANKPGAALVVGTAAVATAKPDGYTIGFTGGPPLYFTPLLQKVPYDGLKDLRMVSQFGAFNVSVIVKKDSPFKSFKEMIEYARKNPKKVTYGTNGTNSQTHIAIESIAKQENVQLTHIPFKGAPETQTAVLGGHIVFGAGDFGNLAESGTVKPLLLLREEKSAEYPNVPILKDLGYNVPYPMVIAIIAPKGVPDAIVKKLDDAVVKAMKEPTFVKGMKDLHLPVVYKNGKEMDAYVARNYDYYMKEFSELGLLKK